MTISFQFIDQIQISEDNKNSRTHHFMVIKSPLVRRKKSRRFEKQIYYSKLGPIGMQWLDF